MKPVNITGQRFGKLVAIEVVSTGKQRLWRCRCDCGTEILAQAKELRAGYKTACTLRCHYDTGEWEGKRFGKLTVIRQMNHPTKRGIYLECLCDCGNIIRPRKYEITEGRTISCGCARRGQPNISNRKDDREVVLSDEYHNYRDNARRRNLAWELNRKEVYKLLLSPCYYCGTPPSREKCPDIHRIDNSGSVILVNGIDRYNNERGYVADNVVPCCHTCNMRKKTIDGDELLAWVKQIYEHRIRE